MTEQEKQQNLSPEQQLEQYVSSLLDTYQEGVKTTTLEAARQVLNDSIRVKEMEAVKEAFQEFKEESKSKLQSKLNEINQQNSDKIVERRSRLPETPELDAEPDLEVPSLESGIQSSYEKFGVLVSKDNNQLPEDIDEALNS